MGVAGWGHGGAAGAASGKEGEEHAGVPEAGAELQAGGPRRHLRHAAERCFVRAHAAVHARLRAHLHSRHCCGGEGPVLLGSPAVEEQGV